MVKPRKTHHTPLTEFPKNRGTLFWGPYNISVPFFSESPLYLMELDGARAGRAGRGYKGTAQLRGAGSAPARTGGP